MSWKAVQLLLLLLNAVPSATPALPADPQVFGLQAISVNVVLSDLNHVSTAQGSELIHALHTTSTTH